MLKRVVRRKPFAGRKLAIDYALRVCARRLSRNRAISHIHDQNAHGFRAEIKSKGVAIRHCRILETAARSCSIRRTMPRDDDDLDESELPDESDMDDDPDGTPTDDC